MSTNGWDVAVIGAGFAGASLAIQLMQRMPAGARIRIVGSPQEVGTGLAYRPANPALLLNVRAARMSLHPEDEGHFVRWLAEHCAGKPALPRSALGQLYASRAGFGRYIRDTLLLAIEQARHRLTVEIIEGTVESLRPAGAGYRIKLANGSWFEATTAALCLGNAPGRLPASLVSSDLAVRQRTIADPWNDERVPAIPSDASILLVGTGLTMVDQALTLRRAGHAGPMIPVSRHGLLPSAQPKTAVVPLDARIPPDIRSLPALFRAIVQAARAESAAGRDWRSVIDGLRQSTQALWQGLDHADKRRFLRHVEAYWSVHRHRMAPAAAERIKAMRQSGQLQVRAARILAVESDAHSVRVTLRPRHSRTEETRSFDWVMNCTGPGRYPSLADQPLVTRLVEQGLARPDSMRFGLDVTPASAVVARNGKPSARLFALGPLTTGRFLEITATREVRAQSAEVADRLAALKLAEMFPRGQSRARSAEETDTYVI